MEEFGQAVQELILLHEQQFQSVVDGDTDSTRFDLLIHMANEKKRDAKYALMRHLEEHGC
jgi:tRNA splicing endonuclease